MYAHNRKFGSSRADSRTDQTRDAAILVAVETADHIASAEWQAHLVCVANCQFTWVLLTRRELCSLVSNDSVRCCVEINPIQHDASGYR